MLFSAFGEFIISGFTCLRAFIKWLLLFWLPAMHVGYCVDFFPMTN